MPCPVHTQYRSSVYSSSRYYTQPCPHIHSTASQHGYRQRGWTIAIDKSIPQKQISQPFAQSTYEDDVNAPYCSVYATQLRMGLRHSGEFDFESYLAAEDERVLRDLSLTRSDIKRLQSLFQSIDECGLSNVSMKQIFSHYGINSIDISSAIFRAFCSNRSEELSFCEFGKLRLVISQVLCNVSGTACALWHFLSMSSDCLGGMIFDLFDRNCSGEMDPTIVIHMLDSIHGTALDHPEITIQKTVSELQQSHVRYTRYQFLGLVNTCGAVISPVQSLQCHLRNVAGGDNFWKSLESRRAKSAQRYLLSTEFVVGLREILERRTLHSSLVRHLSKVIEEGESANSSIQVSPMGDNVIAYMDEFVATYPNTSRSSARRHTVAHKDGWFMNGLHKDGPKHMRSRARITLHDTATPDSKSGLFASPSPVHHPQKAKAVYMRGKIFNSAKNVLSYFLCLNSHPRVHDSNGFQTRQNRDKIDTRDINADQLSESSEDDCFSFDQDEFDRETSDRYRYGDAYGRGFLSMDNIQTGDEVVSTSSNTSQPRSAVVCVTPASVDPYSSCTVVPKTNDAISDISAGKRPIQSDSEKECIWAYDMSLVDLDSS